MTLPEYRLHFLRLKHPLIHKPKAGAAAHFPIDSSRSTSAVQFFVNDQRQHRLKDFEQNNGIGAALRAKLKLLRDRDDINDRTSQNLFGQQNHHQPPRTKLEAEFQVRYYMYIFLIKLYIFLGSQYFIRKTKTYRYST